MPAETREIDLKGTEILSGPQIDGKGDEKTSASAQYGNNPGLSGSELFSIFTADIIREDTIFTR